MINHCYCFRAGGRAAPSGIRRAYLGLRDRLCGAWRRILKRGQGSLPYCHSPGGHKRPAARNHGLRLACLRCSPRAGFFPGRTEATKQPNSVCAAGAEHPTVKVFGGVIHRAFLKAIGVESHLATKICCLRTRKDTIATVADTVETWKPAFSPRMITWLLRDSRSEMSRPANRTTSR